MGCEFFIVNQAITGHAHAFYKEIYEKIKINDRVIDREGGDCIVQWYWKEKEYHIGGELENLDDGTLVSAFKNRKNINI